MPPERRRTLPRDIGQPTPEMQQVPDAFSDIDLHKGVNPLQKDLKLILNESNKEGKERTDDEIYTELNKTLQAKLMQDEIDKEKGREDPDLTEAKTNEMTAALQLLNMASTVGMSPQELQALLKKETAENVVNKLETEFENHAEGVKEGAKDFADAIASEYPNAPDLEGMMKQVEEAKNLTSLGLLKSQAPTVFKSIVMAGIFVGAMTYGIPLTVSAIALYSTVWASTFATGITVGMGAFMSKALWKAGKNAFKAKSLGSSEIKAQGAGAIVGVSSAIIAAATGIPGMNSLMNIGISSLAIYAKNAREAKRMQLINPQVTAYKEAHAEILTSLSLEEETQIKQTFSLNQKISLTEHYASLREKGDTGILNKMNVHLLKCLQKNNTHQSFIDANKDITNATAEHLAKSDVEGRQLQSFLVFMGLTNIGLNTLTMGINLVPSVHVAPVETSTETNPSNLPLQHNITEASPVNGLTGEGQIRIFNTEYQGIPEQVIDHTIGTNNHNVVHNISEPQVVEHEAVLSTNTPAIEHETVTELQAESFAPPVVPVDSPDNTFFGVVRNKLIDLGYTDNELSDLTYKIVHEVQLNNSDNHVGNDPSKPSFSVVHKGNKFDLSELSKKNWDIATKNSPLYGQEFRINSVVEIGDGSNVKSLPVATVDTTATPTPVTGTQEPTVVSNEAIVNSYMHDIMNIDSEAYTPVLIENENGTQKILIDFNKNYEQDWSEYILVIKDSKIIGAYDGLNTPLFNLNNEFFSPIPFIRASLPNGINMDDYGFKVLNNDINNPTFEIQAHVENDKSIFVNIIFNNGKISFDKDGIEYILDEKGFLIQKPSDSLGSNDLSTEPIVAKIDANNIIEYYNNQDTGENNQIETQNIFFNNKKYPLVELNRPYPEHLKHLYGETGVSDPQALVVHYTASNDSLEAVNYLDGSNNVSVQFVVAKDGTIIELFAPSATGKYPITSHDAGSNPVTLGVEIVAEGPNSITLEQQQAVAALAIKLNKEQGINTVVSHQNAHIVMDTFMTKNGKENTPVPYHVDREPSYKTDPGFPTMAKLYGLLRHHGINFLKEDLRLSPKT